MKPESLSELLAWKPPRVYHIISHGILLPETRLIFYGPYKSWKSMLAMHTGFCIASDQQWFGFHTTPSKVLIVQCEIPKALYRERVAKYAKGNSLYPENLYFCTEHYLKLDRDYGLAALDRVMQQLEPNVLIIDPIYKILTGHISDAYDVSKLLDNLDSILARYHCAIILIGHTGKTRYDSAGEVIKRGADQLLGSVYFPAWTDGLVSIEKIDEQPEGDTLHVEFEDMRNIETLLSGFNTKVYRETLQFVLK